jgi:hypothetical protein
VAIGREQVVRRCKASATIISLAAGVGELTLVETVPDGLKEVSASSGANVEQRKSRTWRLPAWSIR